MNLTGQPAHVGRHCGSDIHEITPEVVAFYREALDDPNPLYDEFAPPLLHHSECYRFLGEWYLQNLVGNLHGQQDWECFSAIPIGSTLRSVSTLIDRFSKRGRDYVVNETALFDSDTGALRVRGRTYQSFLPKGAKMSEKGAGEKRAPRPPFPTAEGPDLEPVKKVVDERRCWMFSGPGKNYHTDREQAQKLGFPNIVVQGMMSTCFVSQVMSNAFGMGWLAGGRMSIKLTNVLWVDESVTMRGRIRDESPEGSMVRVHCEVWVEKDDGTRIALGDASAVRET